MFLSKVHSERLVALVVDEAHCVKKVYAHKPSSLTSRVNHSGEYMMIGEAHT